MESLFNGNLGNYYQWNTKFDKNSCTNLLITDELRQFS